MPDADGPAAPEKMPPKNAPEKCPGKNVSDNELSQRDLSTIDEADLNPQERRELQRRFDDFVNQLRARAGLKAPDKPKRITAWDPAAISRRH